MKWLISILLAVALCGCAGTKYVPVREVHTTTATDSAKQIVERWRVDSVYVSHVERIDGERVLVHDTLIRYQRVEVHDTITQVREVCTLDSVPYPVEVTKEVRVRNTYDKFTARGFWVLLAVIVCVIGLWIGSKTPYGKAIVTALRLFVRL